MPDTKSYKDTLNLPATDFPMKANLTAREPERLAGWEDRGLAAAIDAAREGKETFLLHDGPPFANGDIHLGHVLNKTLKDIVLRYKSLAGFRTPYVPGYDCHGLPIEHKIAQKLGPKLRELPKVKVRELCQQHADKFIGVQTEQFKRLGILGAWEDRYATMDPAYEREVVEVFAQFVEHGLVYKQLKPVHWSIANQTALAEAELEYEDRDDPSVYVEFRLANPGAFKAKFELREPADASLMIWTTTPWTLPANRAVAVGEDVEYALVKYDRSGERISVVASDLVEKVFKGRTEPTVLKTVKGRDLLDLTYLHPLDDSERPVVPADYVTTEDGTGLVHTAPGHGEEDYQTGLKHGIEVYCPVQADGRFDSTTPNFVNGLKVFDANPVIIDKLKELGSLFAEQTIHHRYPHDWRSKTPTIYRATEQWFIALDKAYDAGGKTATLRERALEVADTAAFVPEWGRARLRAMLENRPDWCISRQRSWGLPIPIFYSGDGEAVLDPAVIRGVAKAFGERGSDAWFTEEPDALLGDAKAAGWRKESDIFDVWFESGSSWAAVVNARADLPDAPADLYLEGSDQHRGWFQLSLLSALGATGRPPFKATLTHGFTVKPDGTKVSKSDPEYVTATQEIDRHGADLLRLWIASVDWTGDIAASPEIIREFGDKYRKIRNTLRFLLGVTSDFDPAAASVDVPAASLDGWMSHRLDALIEGVTAAYDKYRTHEAFKLLHEFCVVDVSNVYGNAMKDRLYCELPDAPSRRRAQAVLHRVLVALVKLLSPMLVFTSDEAWEHMTHKPAGEADLWSVHLATLPTSAVAPAADEWATLLSLRDDALRQLESLKAEVGLKKATDAEVVYTLPAELRQAFEPYGVDLADLVGAGSHAIDDGDLAVKVIDRREDWALCERSRKRTGDVGSDPNHPTLSKRDAAVVEAL